MGWRDSIDSKIVIKTGDGKRYKASYFLKPKNIGVNYSVYNFPGVKGSLVDRKELIGDEFNFEIIFQGDDNFDQFKEFQESCEDRRPWTVLDPIYGTFKAQLISLTIDPTPLSTTVVSGTYIKTLTEDFPKLKENTEQRILQGINAGNESFGNATANTIRSPQPSEPIVQKNTIEKVESSVSGSIKSTDESNGFLDTLKKAQNAADFYLSSVSTSILATQNLIRYPATISDSASLRIGMLKNQFNSLVSDVSNLITPNEKTLFETNSASTVLAMCETVLTPQDGDFVSSSETLGVANTLFDVLTLWLSALDSIQSDTNSDIESYVPSHDTVLTVVSLMNETISNLLDITLNGKQEREFTLNFDSNVILLAHQFYGLDSQDENIKSIIALNELGVNSYLEIKKGTKIKYLF